MLEDARLSNTHKNSLLASGLSFDRLIKDSLNVIESGKKMKTYYYWPWQSPSLSATKMDGEVISVERKLAENWLKNRLWLFFFSERFWGDFEFEFETLNSAISKKVSFEGSFKIEGKSDTFSDVSFSTQV